MEKKKIKKKSIIIILLILLVISGASVGGYFLYENILTNNIKNNYSELVKTTKKTNIYDKNNNIIGSISKGINIPLTSIKEISKNNKYLKIKDTEYKVYYKDIKKSKEENNTTKNYLPLNKDISTTKKVTLLKDNKKVITLDKGLTTSIEYISNDMYYVNFLNEIYSIKKDESIKEIDNEINKDKEAQHVSVINYNVIEEICSVYECTTINNVKEQISKLKESNYNFITKEEYISFVNNGIRLKENVILLTTSNLNDNAKNISKELNVPIELVNDTDSIKFVSTNKKTKKADNLTTLNRYEVKSYSTVNSVLRMAKGEEVYEADPSYDRSKQKIPVLNYHFFYDPTIGEDCNEVICLTKQKFEEHLIYFRDNGFKTLTIDEFVRWYDGEIDLPPKSVLITVDDGAKGTGAHNGNILIPMLEKYDMHATLFLIAGWWKIDNYISPNLDIQSHTYDMHTRSNCGGGQLFCATYDQAKADIQTSIDIIGRTESFCYPFYEVSKNAKNAVKDLGFRVAFGGGNTKATRSSDRYVIPRYPIQSNHGVDYIKRIVN